MTKKEIIPVDAKDRTGDLSLDFDKPSPDSGDEPFSSKFKQKEYDPNREHPTPEQLLIREAIKWLTPKQRAIWEYYNYDRLTQDEIAFKLGIAQQVVGRHIKACEKKIAKWCQSNMSAYNLLKESENK